MSQKREEFDGAAREAPEGTSSPPVRTLHDGTRSDDAVLPEHGTESHDERPSPGSHVREGRE